jgi:molybdate transport system substrate-binding protein
VSAALLAVGLLGAGCGSPSTPRSAESPSTSAGLRGSVTVFAAASLSKSFTQLGKDFETAHPGTAVTFSFGPSSGLAQQIIAGAPADVFASASPTNMRQVTDAGDATGPVTFARNLAEVAVSPGSASKVTALADLANKGVKVALCQPRVPCGTLAAKVLAGAHVTVHPVTLGLDVKATLAYVTSGQVDAAIVYVTDVQAAGSRVKGVEIPAGLNASTAYEVAPIRASRQLALALAFEQFVLSPAGRAVLSDAGFAMP